MLIKNFMVFLLKSSDTIYMYTRLFLLSLLLSVCPKQRISQWQPDLCLTIHDLAFQSFHCWRLFQKHIWLFYYRITFDFYHSRVIPLECTCSIASWHGSVLTTFSIIFRNVSIICEHNNVYGSLLTHNQLF